MKFARTIGTMAHINYGGQDRGIHINFTVMVFGALIKRLNVSEWNEDDCDKVAARGA